MKLYQPDRKITDPKRRVSGTPAKPREKRKSLETGSGRPMTKKPRTSLPGNVMVTLVHPYAVLTLKPAQKFPQADDLASTPSISTTPTTTTSLPVTKSVVIDSLVPTDDDLLGLDNVEVTRMWKISSFLSLSKKEDYQRKEQT